MKKISLIETLLKEISILFFQEMVDNFYENRFQENVPLANLLLLGLGAVVVRRKR